jgi:aspartokinase/homoserine dehydrogenase 1
MPHRSDSVVVHKFGGTSLATAEHYRHVARTLSERPERRRIVVVSAMGGVTNTLIRAVERAARRDPAYREEMDSIRKVHRVAISDLMSVDAGKDMLERLDRDLTDIADVLHATWLLRSHSRSVLELVSGYGEVWSAQMLTGHFTARGDAAAWMDAREVLVSTWGQTGPEVSWEVSRARLNAWLDERGKLPPTLVVTGYIASSPDGVPTTLGRNGSDFSASIFGSLLEAAEIHIWSDVDGVMSANPRLVPDAVLLDALSYDEAMELAYFGAKVIHPNTMAPAVERGIPIFIRNTFNPTFSGTRIHLRGSSDFAVKGFATVEGVSLVNVEGTGMIGVPGTAQRLFGALREAGISVVMISQGSSEHSICFAVPGEDGDAALRATERAFFAERHQHQIEKIELVNDCCVLAAVGDGMAGHPGVAAGFFGALGKAGINIRAIAQGSSERNISVVIDQAEASRALRAVHSSFYLSPQTLSIGVIGPGVVGSALLAQMAEQIGRLKEELNIDLRVRGLATSRKMVLRDRQIDLADWRRALDEEGQLVDPELLVRHVHSDHLPHAVLIDCTASEVVASHYPEWLRRGISVITPNKRANTASLEFYRDLRAAGRGSGARYFYETTVGAGLPIIQTLRDLIQTGDEIVQIEGILSGTLSYLFNAFDGSRTFSEIVTEARAMGYTEPDPRDDLSGMDVARKVAILAREMGLPLELGEVQVESLVPAELRSGTLEQFMADLHQEDAVMERRRREAAEAGEVLRFVGSIDRAGNASATLRRYPLSHAFARIQLTDNIVQFRTRRYHENPLIVQGPGAGPDVTAGGVFADLLRLAAYLGAPI